MLMATEAGQRAAGPRELAAALGVDAATRERSGASLTPPLDAVRVVPGLFHTQGGLRVDEQARVLRPDGSIIANLFAGGGAAAGISGRAGAAGYASGKIG